MNRVLCLALCLVVGCGLTGGCGSRDKKAEVYAQKLADVLKAYDQEVGKELAAERQAYKHFQATNVEAAELETLRALRYEREERARRLADTLLKSGAGGVPTRSELQDRLREYAYLDFEQMVVLLDDEVTAKERFLEDLEALERDGAKIKSLTDALDGLAKPKSSSQRLKELIQFGEKVNAEYGKLECARLKQELALLIKRINAAPADPPSLKEGLEKQRKALEARIAECEKKVSSGS